ncbi:hypothetical protein HHK36_015415 [Tetracentron sinense]|uniref:non-specific serine/threonine protein kinase n=1 Tax=Tetracentron sinense TaxID=13715 RepID=A0A834Z760_TETSI|nr:hypothetical protein HHK36_015415 [Tetracentron sinense]
MSEDETDQCSFLFFVFFILITGQIVSGSSLQTDKEVLLQLKSFLNDQNKVNRGRYMEWNEQSSSPCNWLGITCSGNGGRVIRIKLSEYNISGTMFGNFSALTELSDLDLSKNTIGGEIGADLSLCKNLKYLNLSHNILHGKLNLTGLNRLEKLDISINRLSGGIQSNFPAICNRLIIANISANNFSGRIDNCFQECWNLQYLDLSSNNFSGQIWSGFQRLREFSVSENFLTGDVLPSIFTEHCNLEILDLSENHLYGGVPKEVSNCKGLVTLNLWGNNFTGVLPSEIGLLSNLKGLYLGSNNFSREIPDSLLNCSKLAFLDLSKNGFGGDIQEIFGRFNQVMYLVLHGNSYTGGIISSGILKLQNVSRLDLSSNKFSGPLLVEFSEMPSIEFLILAFNNFSGNIPPEFGNLLYLQALDLSFNRLTGSIPPAIGKLSRLLWLMLANNLLTGVIPPEIGNCSSLLWLNLANNQLSGKIPPELSNIGRNATPTFESNKQNNRGKAGSGECLVMKRWIPADYTPFSFAYTLLTRKSCRAIWNRLLEGQGLFPICIGGSMVRTLQISGYLQLTGNQFSGEVPAEIGKMQNFSLFNLGVNNFSGKLPPEIGRLPLSLLNLSVNQFSGEIPPEIGQLRCLQNLELSYNNFSGSFPASLNNLTELSKFNISYNPFISGVIPTTGQLATFEKESFLGNPLLQLPAFINKTIKGSTENSESGGKPKKHTRWETFLVCLALTMAFLICGVLSLIVCVMVKSPVDSPEFTLENAKQQRDMRSSPGNSSREMSDSVKVIRLDKTAFTHADILKATGNFSDERIIGKGGYGTVYQGVLPDGREVAVKKLQREGVEGEREFRAEMEVLSGNSFGWPHPNLVALYGWCLHGSEKLLVYEYMEGGSLDDFVSDRTKLTWQRRMDVAVGVASALVFLHHECYPAIVHRDVKASNVLLDKDGKARVTDFGLARVVDAGDSHVSTMVAGTVGYVAPEYGQIWQATTKGDVYSFGVLALELATGRRAVDGGEECLVDWTRRVIGNGRRGFSRAVIPVVLLGSGLSEGAEEMCELLRIGFRCTAEAPQARPNMKEVLAMLIKISGNWGDYGYGSSSPS